jgi:hypothetical protein
MNVLQCGLRWVSEIYPFKKGIAKLFQKCVEVLFNPKCIDFCNAFVNDNHHLWQYL